MSNHIFSKYPSIEQFRHFLKEANYFRNLEDIDIAKQFEKIKLVGSVKIHGTNSAIVYDPFTKDIYTQSRNRLLSLDEDNAGFATYVEANKEFYKETLVKIYDSLSKNYVLVDEHSKDGAGKAMPKKLFVYGEWAGKGIQSKVAVSEVDKFFAPFQIKLTDNSEVVYFCANLGNLDLYKQNDSCYYKDVLFAVNNLYSEEHRCFPISLFEKFEVEVDMSMPEKAQQEIVDMTIRVEEECPVGKYFGVSGVGEGIVFNGFVQYTENGKKKLKHFSFKSKGEKHSASKVKTLNPVDVEKIGKINEFVDYAITEQRLEQGVAYLQEMQYEVEVQNIGVFLKWIVSDVMKEENDTIEANGLDKKLLPKKISEKARKWFFERLNKI